MNKITIRSRLLTLAILPLLILIAVITMALMNSGRVNENLHNLFIDRMKPIDQLKVVSDSYAVSMVDTVHKYRAGLFDLDRLQKEFSQARQTADSAWNNYTSTSLTDKERELITRANQDRAKVSRLVEQLLQDAETGKLRDVEPGAFNKLLYSTFDPLQTELSDLINIQLDEGASLFADSTAQFESARISFLIIGAIALILVLMAALLISISILRPLSNLRDVITSVQETCDLRLRANVSGSDEVSHTAIAFNMLVEHQQALIIHLVSTSVQLASASEDMSVISAQINDNTTRQGDQTHMVATAVHEMSMAVQEVAKNALSASRGASLANQQAAQGSRLVQTSINFIQEVSESVVRAGDVINSLHSKSEEIGEVLGVIQSIAAKTNLLALNAAIEAARAGEAGRGFAVVADEVRALASSTQDATESIRAMVQSLQDGARSAVTAVHDSREQVDFCVRQSNEAGAALNEITKSVEIISAGNEQISTATEEQTSVANEISENIARLNSSISEILLGAQRGMDASQGLSCMAGDLQLQTQRFKT